MGAHAREAILHPRYPGTCDFRPRRPGLLAILRALLQCALRHISSPNRHLGKTATSLPTLYADFVQTFIRAVIPGWIIGSLSGFIVALLCDRYDFLQRGLLPLGNLVAALANRRAWHRSW